MKRILATFAAYFEANVGQIRIIIGWPSAQKPYDFHINE